MSPERLCQACSTRLPGSDPRRIWCSAKCRRWVNKVGGPSRAADLKESWGRDWEELSKTDLGDRKWRQGCLETAERLRGQAAALRNLARGIYPPEGPSQSARSVEVTEG
jgi:hypothetical protein